MSLFDTIILNHALFGSDRSWLGQSKDLSCFGLEYEITPEGRLIDAKGKDLEYHGYLQVYGSGNREWRCKFTDGQLVGAEKESEE